MCLTAERFRCRIRSLHDESVDIDRSFSVVSEVEPRFVRSRLRLCTSRLRASGGSIR